MTPDMRIMWNSNAPWIGSGYGQQTAIWAPRLASLGHDVAISAFSGLNGHPMTWEGIKVYPGSERFGGDILAERARHHFDGEKGLVVTLQDVWTLHPDAVADVPTACWFPVDTAPLSTLDRSWFRKSKAVPVVMSRHGERTAREAGLAPLYVPHGIDVNTFTPYEDRAAVREALGIPADAFVIGMNAANKGDQPPRKAFSQQLEAFAKLHRKHRDAVLFLHTRMNVSDGIDLAPLIKDLGIKDAVMLSDQYAYTSGLLSATYLAGFYNACDVVTNATMAEGFGLAVIESQACGTPVVVTDASSMPELCGAGWVVKGDRYWHPQHEAWWVNPSVDGLCRAYRKAYDGGAAKKRTQAREFAVAYDADKVLYEHWVPALDVLEHGVQELQTKRAA